MPDRQRLDVALAEHRDQVPVPSFPAWRDGRAGEVTAVLERTSVFCPAGGERELARHDLLMVDPAEVTWRKAPPRWRFVGLELQDPGEARRKREGSERRAGEDQAQHGADTAPGPAVMPADPWAGELLALLKAARQAHDELRDDAAAYDLALRRLRVGVQMADPPPVRSRRPTPWPATAVTADDLAAELVRVYALVDLLGLQVVNRRRLLRSLACPTEQDQVEKAPVAESA